MWILILHKRNNIWFFQEVDPVILCEWVKVTWLLQTIACVTFFLNYYLIIIIVFIFVTSQNRANKGYILHSQLDIWTIHNSVSETALYNILVNISSLIHISAGGLGYLFSFEIFSSAEEMKRRRVFYENMETEEAGK